MKWKFVSLESGWDLQIVATEAERDRFARHCADQGIRYGVVRVDEDGVHGEGRARPTRPRPGTEPAR